jgi:hypothetical protein
MAVRTQLTRQHRESADIPIVRILGDRGLQQDCRHAMSLVAAMALGTLENPWS